MEQRTNRGYTRLKIIETYLDDKLCDRTERWNYLMYRSSEKAASRTREKTRLYDVTNQEVNRKTVYILRNYELNVKIKRMKGQPLVINVPY